MERWFYTPQGGADHDYVIWAKEVAGITRARTFRHYKGIGTVGVMVASGDATHPAPPAETVTAVRDHILPLAPVAGGGLFVFPATEKVIPMTIAWQRTRRKSGRPSLLSLIRCFCVTAFLRERYTCRASAKPSALPPANMHTGWMRRPPISNWVTWSYPFWERSPGQTTARGNACHLKMITPGCFIICCRGGRLGRRQPAVERSGAVFGRRSPAW